MAVFKELTKGGVVAQLGQFAFRTLFVEVAPDVPDVPDVPPAVVSPSGFKTTYDISNLELHGDLNFISATATSGILDESERSKAIPIFNN